MPPTVQWLVYILLSYIFTLSPNYTCFYSCVYILVSIFVCLHSFIYTCQSIRSRVYIRVSTFVYLYSCIYARNLLVYSPPTHLFQSNHRERKKTGKLSKKRERKKTGTGKLPKGRGRERGRERERERMGEREREERVSPLSPRLPRLPLTNIAHSSSVSPLLYIILSPTLFSFSFPASLLLPTSYTLVLPTPGRECEALPRGGQY